MWRRVNSVLLTIICIGAEPLWAVDENAHVSVERKTVRDKYCPEGTWDDRALVDAYEDAVRKYREMHRPDWNKRGDFASKKTNRSNKREDERPVAEYKRNAPQVPVVTKEVGSLNVH